MNSHQNKRILAMEVLHCCHAIAAGGSMLKIEPHYDHKGFGPVLCKKVFSVGWVGDG